MKIVDKWLKDAKDGGSLRLWLKSDFSIYADTASSMVYDVCLGCGTSFSMKHKEVEHSRIWSWKLEELATKSGG